MYLVSCSGAAEVISNQYSASQNSQCRSAEGEYLRSAATTPIPPLSVNRYIHWPVNTSDIDVGSQHMLKFPVGLHVLDGHVCVSALKHFGAVEES